MADSRPSAVTLRTRKFMTNRLLSRKQFVLEVIHPGQANVPKTELKDKLAKMYDVKEPNCIVVSSSARTSEAASPPASGSSTTTLTRPRSSSPSTASSGMVLLEKSRKQIKERKNRSKKIRGVKKTKAEAGKKKK